MKSESMTIGSLCLRQSDAKSESIANTKYDVMLSVLSWEKRAATAPSLYPSTGTTHVVRFASRDSETERRKERVLRQLIANLHGAHEPINLGHATEFAGNIRALEAFFRERYSVLKRPLKVLIDISCLPKKYALFVMGLGFQQELFARLDILYTEGHYFFDSNRSRHGAPVGRPRGIVSDGEWASVQIPYLEGKQYIPPIRDLIVSLGGEVSLSMPFLQRYEPRNLELVMVIHSDTRRPDKKPDREIRALQELESQPNTRKFSYEIEDVVSVARHVIKFCRERPSISITGIAVGAKPHALALGLAAMQIPEMDIVCRIPSSYIPSEVEPTGRIFLYTVEDRFEPSAYLSTFSDR